MAAASGLFSHRPELLLILVIFPLFFVFSTAPSLPCFIHSAVLRLLRAEEPPPRQWSPKFFLIRRCHLGSPNLFSYSVVPAFPGPFLYTLAGMHKEGLTVGRRFLLGTGGGARAVG